MQKKDWVTILIGAVTLTATFITGLMTLESRVTRLETSVEELVREKLILFDVINVNTKDISKLQGQLETEDKD